MLISIEETGKNQLEQTQKSVYNPALSHCFCSEIFNQIDGCAGALS
jgi:hypothetical protein